VEILHELEQKAEVLKKLTGRRDAYYIIFASSGFSEGLREVAAKSDGMISIVSRL